jgi:hypothetical protein
MIDLDGWMDGQVEYTQMGEMKRSAPAALHCIALNTINKHVIITIST